MDKKFSLSVTAELDSLVVIRRFVEDTALALQIKAEVISDMLLAVDEAATNIILHGYQGQPGLIILELKLKGDTLIASLRDDAPPFNPTTVPPPDLTLPLERRPLGGMGIHLMRQLMDEMTHHFLPQGGNELILVKKGVL